MSIYVTLQEHEKKRGENFGDPLDLDNQMTLTSSPDQKTAGGTPYGAITNGDPKPPSPEGEQIVLLFLCIVLTHTPKSTALLFSKYQKWTRKNNV